MSTKPVVWVVDDEKNLLFVVQTMLEKAGYSVRAFSDSREALTALKDEASGHKSGPQSLLTDLQMPGNSGMDLLDYCTSNKPDVPVVMMTAFGTVESAVAALKRGAFDYITKPFEKADLLRAIQNALKTWEKRQSEPLSIEGLMTTKEGDEKDSPKTTLVTESQGMQEVYRIITKVAASPTTVLVLGESGTGKELVAYEIHKRSDRATKPFIRINCAAIPATLIESELFGYEKGAFTGAVSSKPGRFELANGGTLFLDEVAEMGHEMQAKLLRVLQEHEFERVGGVQSIQVDVRIITATNRDIEADVKAGRFREDLYYRLNVVPIKLPPLRERKEDIVPLIQNFVKLFNDRLKKSIQTLSSEAFYALRTYSWPGNIRQLENVLERSMLMCEGNALELKDLPVELVDSVGPLPPTVTGEAEREGLTFKEMVRRQTQSLERDLIEKALDENGGNVTRTAEKLGLSRKGLQIKIKELGISRKTDED